MLFEIVVALVLLVLVFKQFNLWEKLSNWLNNFGQHSQEETGAEAADKAKKSSPYNIRGFIFIVIIATIFALVVAYFQTQREIALAANQIVVEQFIQPNNTMTDAALQAQMNLVISSFDFETLFWHKFISNLAIFILLPILISLANIFLNDDFRVAKEQIQAVDISHEVKLSSRKDDDDVFEVKLKD